MAVYLLRILLQRSCLLTVPSRPLFHQWISSDSNSLGTFQSWFLVKLPVYRCSWNSPPLASVNCPASIIHYSFLYSFSGIALFMSQISNGKLAICVSNLVCWHVFIGPQSVLKMFTVAANKKNTPKPCWESECMALGAFRKWPGCTGWLSPCGRAPQNWSSGTHVPAAVGLVPPGALHSVVHHPGSVGLGL